MAKRDDRIRKQIARQTEAVLNEAAAAGATFEDACRVTLDDGKSDGAIDVLKKNLKLFTGGRLKMTSFHSYKFSSRIGEHTYVQPFYNEFPLPGEHHAIVPGSCASSFSVVPSVWQKRSMLKLYIMLAVCTLGLIFLFRLRRSKIVAADKAFAKKLGKERAVRSMFKGVKSNWGIGLTEIELAWTVQVRPLGNGTSHVVMVSGRYGGFTTYKVGFQKFLQICDELKAQLPERSSPEREFITKPSYDEIAMDFGRQFPSPPGAQPCVFREPYRAQS